MALTQVSTDGIKNGTISSADLGSNLKVTGSLFEVENTGGNANFEVTRVSGANFRIQSQASSVRLDTVGASHPILLGTNGNGRIRINDSTVDLINDNQKLRIGTGHDLEIYHSGTNSIIDNINTSASLHIKSPHQLKIKTGQFVLKNTADTENLIYAAENDKVALYHDNSAKLETTSAGVTVTGTLTADTVRVLDNEAIGVGASTDLQMYHDASGSVYGTSGASYIKVQGTHDNIFDIFTASATGKISLKSSNLAETMLSATGNGAVELYFNNSKKFETTTTGADVSGGLLVDTVNAVINVSSAYSYKYGYFGDADQQSLTVRGNEACLEVFASDQSFHGGSIVLRGGNEGFGFVNNSSNDRLELVSFTAGGNSFALHNGGANLTNYDRVFVANKNGSIELYNNNSKKLETTSSGVKFTGTLEADDNQSILLGDSDDFRIRHTGSNSEITDEGTGKLRLGSNQTEIRSADLSAVQAQFISGGAVKLYHNTNQKFETTSSGVEITGTNILLNDDSAITGTPHTYNYGRAAGATSSLSLYGAESALEIVSSDDGTHGGSLLLRTTTDGAGLVYNPSTNALELITFATSANSFLVHNGGSSTDQDTQLRIVKDGAVELNHNGSKKFETTSLGATVSGRLDVAGLFTGDNFKILVGNSDDLQIYHDGSNSYIQNDTGNLLFKTGSTERLRINSDTNGRYLGRTPLNPAESAEEIKNDISGTPDNDWYYIKQFGNVARLHYCVFKDQNGNDIAGGPWTMNWIAGVYPNQFSTNGSTALGQYLNLCKGIGIDKPGRGMESSRSTAQVYGAWLAVKRALWDLDPGFFNGASSGSGGVLLMPLMNINGEGGSSDHRLVYSTGTSTHIPPNQDGDHCSANQLFCGWWGGNDFSSWATNNNNVPSPEDWGPGDSAHTGNIGARSNSTPQKPSWKDMMLVTCVYK